MLAPDVVPSFTHADVDTALASTVRGFDDLFETSAPNGSMCTDPTITPVDVDGTSTCLKVKAGLESVATRLETHRVAASRGATMEWTGAAGLAFDPDHGRVYLALSSVGGTMSDGKGDIRDPGPNACGAVIAFGVLTSATDQFGSTVEHITKTLPGRIAAAAPCSPNSTASVCAALTTTLTMTSQCAATACAARQYWQMLGTFQSVASAYLTTSATGSVARSSTVAMGGV